MSDEVLDYLYEATESIKSAMVEAQEDRFLMLDLEEILEDIEKLIAELEQNTEKQDKPDFYQHGIKLK